MTDNEFSVCQFFADGSYDYDVRSVGAARAVERFKALISSVGARIGTTKRVIVTDGGDCINLEWQHGKGITYNPNVTAAREWSAPASTPATARVRCSACGGAGDRRYKDYGPSVTCKKCKGTGRGAPAAIAATECDCTETYPQLTPGVVSHGPGCTPNPTPGSVKP